MNRGYQRQSVKQPTKRDQQAKLLLLILKRSFSREISDCFNEIKIYSKKKANAVSSIYKIYEHCSFLSKTIAWSKLKANVLQTKSEERLFKNVLTLSKRIQLNVMKFAFQQIKKRIYQSNNSAFQKIEKSKKSIMFQTLKKLIVNQKKIAWSKMQNYMIYKRQIKRIMVTAMIVKSAQKRLILTAWGRLLLQTGRSANMVANKGQKQDLDLQIQDLRVQVENKNVNITRLQQELDDIRQSSYRQDANNYSNNNYFYPLSNSNRSLRSSRRRLNSSMDKDSNDGSVGKDLSFGSLLGGSFFTVKSKNSTKKLDCNCEYSLKYDKYKAAAQSYKNQLQIIKAELEFTKEMYDHMENQMKVCVGNDEKDRKIQKLQGQIREIQKDREALRDKVAKYQKYVGKLKSQFKMKIEEIYRKVRKGN